jgi:hypothetical protein
MLVMAMARARAMDSYGYGYGDGDGDDDGDVDVDGQIPRRRPIDPSRLKHRPLSLPSSPRLPPHASILTNSCQAGSVRVSREACVRCPMLESGWLLISRKVGAAACLSLSAVPVCYTSRVCLLMPLATLYGCSVNSYG